MRLIVPYLGVLEYFISEVLGDMPQIDEIDAIRNCRFLDGFAPDSELPVINLSLRPKPDVDIGTGRFIAPRPGAEEIDDNALVIDQRVQEAP